MRKLLKNRDDAWCTSEQIAKIFGFSRAYADALVDSDQFSGQVQRTAEGRCRVKKAAVLQWMRKNGVKAAEPIVGGKNVLWTSPPEFFEEPALSEEERSAKRAARIAARRDSLKHKPPKRR